MLKIALRLFSLSILCMLLFSSCAKPRIELPSYDGVDVKDVLAEKSTISSIETDMSITFEKDDTEIKGNGILNISKNGDMTLRIYSFGFLAFELISEDGLVRSKPLIERQKGTILTYGLRDCLFWWDVEDNDILEDADQYLLQDSSRIIWMDKKTLLPVQQIIALQDGRELNILYDNPAVSDNIWYPSKIRIELVRYAVTLKIKDILFALGA